MKFISIVALFAVMLWMIVLGSQIMAFIDVPSLLLVVTVCLFAILARHGPSGFRLLFDAEQNEAVIQTLGYAGLSAVRAKPKRFCSPPESGLLRRYEQT